MRNHLTLPATLLSLGMLASAGCSDQAPELTTAPEIAGLEAPGAASFQQNVDQVTFGNLIAALNNINAKIIALNNIDIDLQDVTVNVVSVDDIIVELNNNQIRLLNINIENVDVDALQNFLNDFVVDVDIEDLNILAVDVNIGTGDITLFTVSDTTVSDFDLNTLDLQ